MKGITEDREYVIETADREETLEVLRRFLTDPQLTAPECTAFDEKKILFSTPGYDERLPSAVSAACVASTDPEDTRRVTLTWNGGPELSLNFPYALDGLNDAEQALLRRLAE